MSIPGGVFDMVRVMTLGTGVKIAVDLASAGVNNLFREECPKCHATGMLTCPKCKGSKNLRSRPSRIVIGGPWRKGGPKVMLLHHAHEMSECWKCGKATLTDFDMCSIEQNDSRVANKLVANFMAAQIGEPMPHLFEPTAGTVVCDKCWGHRYNRLTSYNFDKLVRFTLPDIWYRMTGGWEGPNNFTGNPHFPQTEHRKVGGYLEFPNHPRPFTVRQLFKPAVRCHPMLVPSLRGLKNLAKEDFEAKNIDVEKRLRMARKQFRLSGTRRLPQIDDEKLKRRNPHPRLSPKAAWP